MSERQFSLTEGGPVYRFEMRIGLTQANPARIARRAAMSILITWVPLLVLSALQGTAIGKAVPIPFLHDFAVHTRFLLAVPLLLLAENILGPRLARVVDHFENSGLITLEDRAQFDQAIDDGLRWRDSTLAEVIIAVLAFIMGAIALVSAAVHVSTWYALRSSSGTTLTWAGWWFSLVCIPLFQFLTLRWLWRLFLWGQFLRRVNRLNLQLMPTHPDAAGGLAFVGDAQRFFGILLFAFSAAVAGIVANEVIYDKDPLPNFGPAIAAYIVIAVVIILSPMLIFSGRLLKTKRTGIYEYGTFANEYTRDFYRKWILEPRDPAEVLLGTADIQSLADLGNSYSFVERMRGIPIGSRTLIHLILACLVPMVPLLLTVMPLKELLELAFKMLH